MAEQKTALVICAHPAGPISADFGGEYRADPVPPKPHRLMANLDAALMQKIFDIAK